MEGVCDASISTLIDLCMREISVFQDLQEDAGELKKTLGKILSFLGDAQTKSITEAAAKTWLNELEALVLEADEILDKLKHQILPEKINNVDAKERKMAMSSCFPAARHASPIAHHASRAALVTDNR